MLSMSSCTINKIFFVRMLRHQVTEAAEEPIIKWQISTILWVILKYYCKESYFSSIILYIIYMNYAVNV